MNEPRPKKSFGQHFLTDLHAAMAIAEAATPTVGGTVLEIGPGKGALTRHLLARAAKVIAVERDRDLIPYLQEAFSHEIAEGRLRLIEEDAAKFDWNLALEQGSSPRMVAGNIPYNITGKLLEIAIHHAHCVDGVVFLMQKEVADRLTAAPGSGEYGALSVFTQAAFVVERVRLVRRGAFFPPPKVESAVIRFHVRRPPLAEETPIFRELVKRAFLQRRKTLRNAWRGIFGWDQEFFSAQVAAAGISLDARGETLHVLDFNRIAQGIAPLLMGKTP